MRVLIVRNNSNHNAFDASMLLMASADAVDRLRRDLTWPEFDDASTRVEVARMAAADLDLAVVGGKLSHSAHGARVLGSTPVPLLGVDFGHQFWRTIARRGGSRSSRAPRGRARGRGAAACSSTWCARASLSPFGDGGGLRCACAHLFALNKDLTRGAMGRIIEFSLDVSGRPSPASEGRRRGGRERNRNRPPTRAFGENRLWAPSFNGLVVWCLAPRYDPVRF